MIKEIIIVFLLVSLSPITILSQDTQSSLYYSLGSYSMQEYNYEEALKNFQLSIKYNEPKIKEATIESGVCNKILGNYQEAIKFGEKALQYELEDWEKGRVYWLIGVSYGFLEDYKTAFSYFELMKQSSNLYDIPEEFKSVKEGWYYITQSNYDNIYYNKNTIKKNEKGKINVWLKWYWDEKTMNEEDREKIFKYGNDTEAVNRRINEIMKERENVSYTLNYVEYDFINNQTRLLEAIKYDKKGNVLESISWENSEDDKVDSKWSNIVPGSVGEMVFNKLKNKYYK